MSSPSILNNVSICNQYMKALIVVHFYIQLTVQLLFIRNAGFGAKQWPTKLNVHITMFRFEPSSPPAKGMFHKWCCRFVSISFPSLYPPPFQVLSVLSTVFGVLTCKKKNWLERQKPKGFPNFLWKFVTVHFFLHCMPREIHLEMETFPVSCREDPFLPRVRMVLSIGIVPQEWEFYSLSIFELNVLYKLTQPRCSVLSFRS